LKKNSILQNLFSPRTWFTGELKPAEQMALGMGVALLALSIIADLRGLPLRAEKLSIIATLIAGIGIAYPRALLPFEKLLRNAVLGLAWLNTKVSLTLVYYLVFTPAAFLLKLFGKKLLDTEFKKNVDSYFEPKQEPDYKPERDELQF
jgi:hypothetical protein